jgi:hypothetical protein
MDFLKSVKIEEVGNAHINGKLLCFAANDSIPHVLKVSANLSQLFFLLAIVGLLKVMIVLGPQRAYGNCFVFVFCGLYFSSTARNATIYSALQNLIQHNILSAPVVKEHCENPKVVDLVGIVSMLDLVVYLCEKILADKEAMSSATISLFEEAEKLLLKSEIVSSLIGTPCSNLSCLEGLVLMLAHFFLFRLL